MDNKCRYCGSKTDGGPYCSDLCKQAVYKEVEMMQKAVADTKPLKLGGTK